MSVKRDILWQYLRTAFNVRPIAPSIRNSLIVIHLNRSYGLLSTSRYIIFNRTVWHCLASAIMCDCFSCDIMALYEYKNVFRSLDWLTVVLSKYRNVVFMSHVSQVTSVTLTPTTYQTSTFHNKHDMWHKLYKFSCLITFGVYSYPLLKTIIRYKTVARKPNSSCRSNFLLGADATITCQLTATKCNKNYSTPVTNLPVSKPIIAILHNKNGQVFRPSTSSKNMASYSPTLPLLWPLQFLLHFLCYALRSSAGLP